MSTKSTRALDFSLLPAIEGMDTFIRLDRATEARFAELAYLRETYERAAASLMFLFQTTEKDERWRNDARLRAGLNEFYSLEAAVVRDLRAARMTVTPPRLRESQNPLIHLMYILRHIGVHSKPVPTGVSPITVISDYDGSRFEHSYGAVVLESLAIDDLLRSNEVKDFYSQGDLKKMVDWIMSAQEIFGVGEVFRKGIDCYCKEIQAVLWTTI
jgi:hypothetical protein